MKSKIFAALTAIAMSASIYGVVGSTSAIAQESASVAQPNTSSVKDFTIGDPAAPVTIVEYLSFTCPHCRSFHENAFQQLKTDYIDAGKVKFTFREVYFDRFGLWAAMVARCDNGSRYHGIVDLLFKEQGEWTKGSPIEIVGNLKRIGKIAGLEEATLDACLSDANKAAALNAYYLKNAEEDSIRATPSFVINGTTHNNMSYEDLRKIIDGLE